MARDTCHKQLLHGELEGEVNKKIKIHALIAATIMWGDKQFQVENRRIKEQNISAIVKIPNEQSISGVEIK